MGRAQEEARRLVEEGTAYEDEGAIRIRMPDEGTTGWDDAVKGRIDFPSEQLEDLVLVRSDGRPTYNFASPLEDWLDGITHVIRGDDHVSNTPKQIVVLQALGAEPPVYAHVPNVFGTDGKKLSKRHGAVSVDEFREAGYVAPALLNFLALLSLSLAIINLLPIPVLDGGHLLYYLIELVKGSPLSERAMAAGQYVGLALLAGLMGLAFYNAALNVDYQVLLGFTVLATVATILGNLLADIGYAILDPRVRYS